MPSETARGSNRSAGRAASGSQRSAESVAGSHRSATTAPGHGYVVPWVHLSVPESLVNASFWTAVVGATLAGAVDPPLAALIGAGVIVSKHRNSS